MTNQVLRHLESGERMDAPEACPPEVYSLMRETWAAEPASRPTFATILQRLEERRLRTPSQPVRLNDPWVAVEGNSNDDTYDSISELTSY